WHISLQQRTQGYAKTMRQVADAMGLEFKSELYDIDGAFQIRSKLGYPIPIVLIEWENNRSAAHHEVRKLLSMQVPLRVLFLVSQWSKDQYPKRPPTD